MPVVIDHNGEHRSGCVVKIFEVVERRDALVRGNELVRRIYVHSSTEELHPNYDENQLENQKQKAKRGKFWQSVHYLLQKNSKGRPAADQLSNSEQPDASQNDNASESNIVTNSVKQ